MWNDPIVEEVRKHREEHAAKLGYDLAAICADLRRRQEESGRAAVRFPPKPSRYPEKPRQAAG